MVRTYVVVISVVAGAFLAGLYADHGAVAEAQGRTRVFELRTYTTGAGKLDPLLARFRQDETALFEKHGMHGVGYWVPTDEPLAGHTLVYLLAHESREAARASWEGFRNDPQWHAVRDRSQTNGRLVTKVESIFLSPTDFSPTH